VKVAILVEDLVEEVELVYPYFRFKELGAEVDIVGPDVKEYRGKHNVPLKAGRKADPALADEYDVLWIPGGYAPDRLRRHGSVLEMVKRVYESGKIVAAVCHGPWVLVSAGIIKGKKVTGWVSIHDDLRNAGAELVDKPLFGNAVRDGNLITGTDPEAMPSMMKLLIQALNEKGLI